MYIALVYFFFYAAQLLFTLENEVMHWITLVIVPAFIYIFFYRINKTDKPINSLLSIVGITKTNWKKALMLAVIIGLLLSGAQFFLSKRTEQIIPLITSGKVLLVYPLTIVLLFITAAFTEEFFFIGILLTRIYNNTKSKYWAIAISSLLFELYHFTYAYLKTRWSSYGDISAALSTSLLQGGIADINISNHINIGCHVIIPIKFIIYAKIKNF